MHRVFLCVVSLLVPLTLAAASPTSPEQPTLDAEQVRPVLQSTLPRGFGEFRIALGARHRPPGTPAPAIDSAVPFTSRDELRRPLDLAFGLHLSAGLTDRLQWAVQTPAFAYRLGDRGATEWIPWGGLSGWGFGYSSIEKLLLAAMPTAGLDVRHWLSPMRALNFTVGAVGVLEWSQVMSIRVNRWSVHATAGYSHSFGQRLTLNVGARAGQYLLVRDAPAHAGASTPGRYLSVGSVQKIGFRPLPLVQLHLNDRFTLDGYASSALRFDDEQLENTVMLGVTVDI